MRRLQAPTDLADRGVIVEAIPHHHHLGIARRAGRGEVAERRRGLLRRERCADQEQDGRDREYTHRRPHRRVMVWVIMPVTGDSARRLTVAPARAATVHANRVERPPPAIGPTCWLVSPLSSVAP